MNNNHPCCQSHCCLLHGCKYNYDDCPVVLREVKQDHCCETCSVYENISTLEEMEVLYEIREAGPALKINAIHVGLSKLQLMNPEDKDVRLMRAYLENLIKQEREDDYATF